MDNSTLFSSLKAGGIRYWQGRQQTTKDNFEKHVMLHRSIFHFVPPKWSLIHTEQY